MEPRNEREAHRVMMHGACKPTQGRIAPAPIRTRPTLMRRLLRFLGLAS